MKVDHRRLQLEDRVRRAVERITEARKRLIVEGPTHNRKARRASAAAARRKTSCPTKK